MDKASSLIRCRRVAGCFDSWYTDPVAAVLRDDGILLIYNGVNARADSGGDSRLQVLCPLSGPGAVQQERSHAALETQ